MSTPTGMGPRTAAHWYNINSRLRGYVNQRNGNYLYSANQQFHHIHPSPAVVHKHHGVHRRHRHYAFHHYDDEDSREYLRHFY
ncbi:hypothetical protein I4U23_022133 [Adineta vaga]|nr:hypothetical protein I4U23_022133 [Adineta vaga]